MLLRLCVFIACLLTLPPPVMARPVALVDQHYVSLGASAEVLEDPSAALTIEDVRLPSRRAEFRPALGPIENHGFTRSAFWFRFSFSNEGQHRHWILEVPDGLVFHLDSYLLYPDGQVVHKASGSTVPASRKDMRSRMQLIRMDIPTGQSVELLVRVATELALLVPFNLWRADIYSEAAVADVSVHYLYFGMMFAIMTYSLFVGLSLRESTYLYYIPFLFSAMVAFLHLYGFLLQWIALEDYWIARVMWLSVMSTMVFCNRFSMHFLEIPRLCPAVVKWFDYGLALKLLLTLSLLIIPANWGPILLVVVVLGTTFLCLLAAFLSSRRGFWPARLYLASWALLTLGIVSFVLMSVGILPRNDFTYNSMQIGSAAEALLLTYSLGVRVRVINTEKESVLSQLSRQDKMAALGLLSAGVAHEINNPTQFTRTSIESADADLKAFRQFLDSLMDEPDPELEAEFNRRTSRISDHLMLAKQGTQRISDIVRSMRAVSRSDDGQPVLFDPVEAMQSSVQLVNATWKHVVQIDLYLEECGRVRGRASELGQVFMNLLVNACHAIEERRQHDDSPGRIEVRSWLSEGAIHMSIQDNGCGMSEDTMSRLFEPFFTTKGTDRGTGLGMGIIKRILDSHHGRLEIRSRPGEGTLMTVILPGESTAV